MGDEDSEDCWKQVSSNFPCLNKSIAQLLSSELRIEVILILSGDSSNGFTSLFYLLSIKKGFSFFGLFEPVLF